MNGADWAILAIVLLSVIQAAWMGFFHEAFGMAGLVAGYLVAAWQYQHVSNWFARYLKSSWLPEIAGFLIIFLAVMILATVAGRITRWMMKEAGMSFYDRVLGAALGLVRGCLIAAVVLMSMTAFTPASKWLEGSRLAPYFLVAGRAAIWVAPAELRARFYQGLDVLQRAQQSPAGATPSPK